MEEDEFIRVTKYAMGFRYPVEQVKKLSIALDVSIGELKHAIDIALKTRNEEHYNLPISELKALLQKGQKRYER